jgi:hypothetical protein
MLVILTRLNGTLRRLTPPPYPLAINNLCLYVLKSDVIANYTRVENFFEKHLLNFILQMQCMRLFFPLGLLIEWVYLAQGMYQVIFIGSLHAAAV